MDSQTAADREQQYRLIFENLDVGVLLHTLDGSIVGANAAARRLLELPPAAEGASIAFPELVGEDGLPLSDDEYPAQRVAATRSVTKGLVAGVRRSAHEIAWFVFDGVPAYNEDGEIVSTIVSFDKAASTFELRREALRDRGRLELASRATSSVVFDWNLKTEDFWANDNFRTIFGFAPPAKLRVTDAPRYVFAEDRKRYQALLLHALEHKHSRLEREFRFVKPNGEIGIAQSEFLIQYSEDGEPERIIGSKRDMTELRRKEEELAASEERFRIVTALSSDMLWEFDPVTAIVWRAPDGLERLGVDPVRAPRVQGLWESLIAPDERDRVLTSFHEALAGEAEQWREEYHIQQRGGATLLVEDRAAIIRSSSGEATRVVGAVRDITETRRMEEFMRENQALEALGQLTGGVAHDFNNMLMIIMGNTEILLDGAPDLQTRGLLELIETAARNGAELTSRLLSFARQQPLVPRVINIADQMEQSAKLIRHGLPEEIALSVRVEETDLRAQVDTSQLDNALVNLALNARDAMPCGGTITLQAASYQVDEGTGEAVLPPGAYVRIALCDTGTGMEPAVVSRAFEPFFTTKPTGQGTGLGLSMVYGFAKQSGGHAAIDSTPGEGTCVTLFLPATLRRDQRSDRAEI